MPSTNWSELVQDDSTSKGMWNSPAYDGCKDWQETSDQESILSQDVEPEQKLVNTVESWIQESEREEGLMSLETGKLVDKALELMLEAYGKKSSGEQKTSTSVKSIQDTILGALEEFRKCEALLAVKEKQVLLMCRAIGVNLVQGSQDSRICASLMRIAGRGPSGGTTMKDKRQSSVTIPRSQG